MRTRRAAALALGATLAGGVLLAVAVVPAAARGRTCAASATVLARHGHGSITVYNRQHPGGARFTAGRMTRSVQFFRLHDTSIKLGFGHNTFVLGGEAVFTLACSGVTRAQGAIMPDIGILRGTATVTTTRTVLGSISTEEGLFGPVTTNPAMTFRVARTLGQHGRLTYDEMQYWFHHYTNQPRGTSTTSAPGHTKRINVTPYVGPRIGSCRHAYWAELTTTSTFGHGTAKYRL